MPNETRATRYHRARLQAGAGAFLVSLLVLVASGPLGVGPMLAGALTAMVGESALAGWAATALFAAMVLVAAHAASYPFDRHREWTLEGRYGLARLSARRWLRAHLRGIAARITVGVAVALVVAATWMWCGGAWWIATAAVCYLAHLSWTVAAPLLLGAFGGLRPLRRPALAARLDALVRRSGVDLAVREWRGGDETTQAHAALAGLGRTRQILLSDTLVDTLRDEEIEVVVAHEIGHHAHGDVWRAAAWRLVALPLTIGAAAAVLARLGAPPGAWPLAPALASPSASLPDALPWLPVFAAAALAAHRVLEPIGLALSRGRELRADAYAVRLTGGADAFVTSMRRLSQTNLVDDQPPRLARVLSSHPPVRDRVMAALRQAERVARTQGAVAGPPV
jgi:STE24 endopeptidase